MIHVFLINNANHFSFDAFSNFTLSAKKIWFRKMPLKNLAQIWLGTEFSPSLISNFMLHEDQIFKIATSSLPFFSSLSPPRPLIPAAPLQHDMLSLCRSLVTNVFSKHL